MMEVTKGLGFFEEVKNKLPFALLPHVHSTLDGGSTRVGRS